MEKSDLKYSALVFLGGACYGIQGPIVKMAYAAGFTWNQMVASQAIFGALLFSIALLIMRLRGKELQPLSPKRILALVALGVGTCANAALYNFSLSLLPASVAVTLLFQFTWMGIIVQLIVARRRPRTAEVVAAAIIVLGTLFAGGVFSEAVSGLNLLGVGCGLLAAVGYALIMLFFGRLSTSIPPVQRGFVVGLGSCVLALVICPDYFTSGALADGLWQFGLAVGVCALFVPVILLGIATPHLSTGLATIMASSELPCGIIASVVVLGESMDTLQLIGIATILTGVVIAQLPNLVAQKRENG